MHGWRLQRTSAHVRVNQATKPRRGDAKPRLGRGCPVNTPNQVAQLKAPTLRLVANHWSEEWIVGDTCLILV